MSEKVNSEVGSRKEKQDETFVEHAHPSMFDDEKAVRSQGDYSGAVAKTDPREIQLVRKLDMRMMPIVWAMYFLNYVGSRAPCQLFRLLILKHRSIAMLLRVHVLMDWKTISDSRDHSTIPASPFCSLGMSTSACAKRQLTNDSDT